jgi:hypothetical protein
VPFTKRLSALDLSSQSTVTDKSLAAHQAERNGLSRNFFSSRFISGNLWDIPRVAKFQGAIFRCDGPNRFGLDWSIVLYRLIDFRLGGRFGFLNSGLDVG